MRSVVLAALKRMYQDYSAIPQANKMVRSEIMLSLFNLCVKTVVEIMLQELRDIEAYACVNGYMAHSEVVLTLLWIESNVKTLELRALTGALCSEPIDRLACVVDQMKCAHATFISGHVQSYKW